MSLINPNTGRSIKIGGTTHMRLVQSGIVSRETLDTNKVEVHDGSRQKRESSKLEFHESNTHWTNPSEICKQLDRGISDLIEFLEKFFPSFRLIYNDKKCRIIFPKYEPFIDRIVDDFVSKTVVCRECRCTETIVYKHTVCSACGNKQIE
ncbi:MAG: hypothetical protein JSS09_00360 [Verrucomicrobia bacterium]|nr:hypothetical protein [Verrucomicrobiota bacterium]